MKTFLIRNRFGREVQVPENVALMLKGNPSVKILGELETTTEQKEISVPVRNKPAAKVVRSVAKILGIKKDSVPGMDADIEYTGNMIKQKTVLTKSGKEVKKSKILHE